ncbi:MAG TPA: hypothetical protein VE820_13815 [Sphingomicrobium sp.]|nr:hypothetical protein [Sphingomicrobium sp.]
MQRTELKTELIVQQTPSWCWAASASMALEILRVPDINPGKNYQCGVVAAAFPRCEDDCSQCDTTIPTMLSLIAVLNRYRDLAFSSERGRKSLFTADYVAHPTFALIKRSFDISAPVIGGISPDLPRTLRKRQSLRTS